MKSNAVTVSVEGSAEQTFALRRVRRLEGEASADYCALQPGAQTVDLASERPFKLVYDSVNPVKSDNVDVKKQGKGGIVKISDYQSFLQKINLKFIMTCLETCVQLLHTVFQSRLKSCLFVRISVLDLFSD